MYRINQKLPWFISQYKLTLIQDKDKTNCLLTSAMCECNFHRIDHLLRSARFFLVAW